MAEHSRIEWTDATWNPIRARNLATGKVGWHCTHASEGCRNCYAERINRRLGTGIDYKPQLVGRDVEVFLDAEMLTRPLRWRKPRRIFVGSMTDLFGDFVTDEMIDRVFAVMALAGRHTFQILTKRGARMRQYLGWESLSMGRITKALLSTPGGGEAVARAGYTWPLPNVWLGVSAEDQANADERIPDLLQTPAAVRFLSAEPLLGPIDLRGHVRPWRGCGHRSWSTFQWPAWVPERTRAEVEGFWRAEYGRGPDQWLRGAQENGQPTLGARGRYSLTDREAVEGRFVPAWNSIGRAIDDEGRAHVVAEGRWTAAAHLDWVIAGGESGPGARPMHPDWPRQLRDQCAPAGVPFFFKQWGEWSPNGEPGCAPGASWGDDINGWWFVEYSDQLMATSRVFRIGKKAAGRLLDGQTHDATPEPANG